MVNQSSIIKSYQVNKIYQMKGEIKMLKAIKFQNRINQLQKGLRENEIHNENTITESQILMNKLCSIATLREIGGFLRWEHHI